MDAKGGMIAIIELWGRDIREIGLIARVGIAVVAVFMVFLKARG